MIRSFRHKGLERLFVEDDRRGVRADLAPRVTRLLALLDAADRPEAMNVGGVRLHALKGNLNGFWSVSVNANWRLVFRFADGEATEVDLLDYH